MTLVAEISRYILNIPCLEVEDLLTKSKDGLDNVLELVNQFNGLLYDVVIPRLFNQLYEIEEETQTEDYEVELVKEPPEGFYEVSGSDDLTVTTASIQQETLRTKSFHLDTYCFNSI